MTRPGWLWMAAALMAAGCGAWRPEAGREAILVDRDRKADYVLLDAGTAELAAVQIPAGTRVRVVEIDEHPKDGFRGDVTINVLEGEHAGDVFRAYSEDLAPAR